MKEQDQEDVHQDAALTARLKGWARAVKRDVVALFIAARDPRVPWYVKAAAMAIAAYALSPIDLIPDFIPVLGYLDEVIILPVAMALVIRMIPDPLMAEFRETAQRRAERPVSRVAAAVIVALWIAAAGCLLWALWPTPTS
ncbi:MAG TPA: YkvA family protein [Microvirga sp.]|nr:YkvA family protein [Microvirga sp.]